MRIYSKSKGSLDYGDALRRVMSLPDFERSTRSPGHSSFHLERMGLLMETLGNPHLEVPTVHIAGTKGKGSTAAMVTSVLTAQGYRTGLYTSPHLHSVVERIRVGLEPIARETFAELVEQIWPVVESAGQHGEFGPISFFEIMTAMAFLHFRQTGADFQVIEVGLGGRLDATNVVAPEVSVITSISLDHTATLGDTVALIAAEKAGIIKPRVPVVLAPQQEEAREVLQQIAGERLAQIIQVGEDVIWTYRAHDIDGQSFDVDGTLGRYSVWTPLIGDHQISNAATAIAAIETLVARGFDVSVESIVGGLRRVRWPARLQVLARDGTLVVADGAHNPDSMGRLAEAVRKYFDFGRIILVIGATTGHSAQGMLAEVAQLAPLVVAVQSRHPKSASHEHIAAAAREQGLRVIDESNDVGAATRAALDMSQDGDMVLATGSLSVAAEFVEEIEGIEPELYPNLKRPSKAG